LVGYATLEHVHRVGTENAQVIQPRFLGKRQQLAHSRPMHLDTDKPCLRLPGGEFGQAEAHAEADLQRKAPAVGKQCLQVEETIVGSETTRLPEGLERQTLGRGKTALTAHEAADVVGRGISVHVATHRS
jgi:hypothetical protein